MASHSHESEEDTTTSFSLCTDPSYCETCKSTDPKTESTPQNPLLPIPPSDPEVALNPFLCCLCKQHGTEKLISCNICQRCLETRMTHVSQDYANSDLVMEGDEKTKGETRDPQGNTQFSYRQHNAGFLKSSEEAFINIEDRHEAEKRDLIRQLESKTEECERERKERAQKFDKNQELLTQFGATSALYEQETRILNERCEKLNRENGELTQSLEDARQQLDKAESRIIQESENRRELKTQLDQLTAEITRLTQDTTSGFEKSFDHVQKQLKTLKEKLNEELETATHKVTGIIPLVSIADVDKETIEYLQNIAKIIFARPADAELIRSAGYVCHRLAKLTDMSGLRKCIGTELKDGRCRALIKSLTILCERTLALKQGEMLLTRLLALSHYDSTKFEALVAMFASLPLESRELCRLGLSFLSFVRKELIDIWYKSLPLLPWKLLIAQPDVSRVTEVASALIRLKFNSAALHMTVTLHWIQEQNTSAEVFLKFTRKVCNALENEGLIGVTEQLLKTLTVLDQDLLNLTLECLLVLLPGACHNAEKVALLSDLVNGLKSDMKKTTELITTRKDAVLQLMKTVLALETVENRTAVDIGFVGLEFLIKREDNPAFLKLLMEQLQSERQDAEHAKKLLVMLTAQKCEIIEARFHSFLRYSLPFHTACVLSAQAIAQCQELEAFITAVLSILKTEVQFTEQRNQFFDEFCALVQKGENVSTAFHTVRLSGLLHISDFDVADALKLSQMILAQLNTDANLLKKALPLMLEHKCVKVTCLFANLFLGVWDERKDRAVEVCEKFLSVESTEETVVFLERLIRFMNQADRPYQLAFKLADFYHVLTPTVVSAAEKLTSLLNTVETFSLPIPHELDILLLLLEQNIEKLTHTVAILTLEAVLLVLSEDMSLAESLCKVLEQPSAMDFLKTIPGDVPLIRSMLVVLSEQPELEAAFVTLFSLPEAADFWDQSKLATSQQRQNLIKLLRKQSIPTVDNLRTALLIYDLMPDVPDLVSYVETEFSKHIQGLRELLKELKVVLESKHAIEIVGLVLREDISQLVSQLTRPRLYLTLASKAVKLQNQREVIQHLAQKYRETNGDVLISSLLDVSDAGSVVKVLLHFLDSAISIEQLCEFEAGLIEFLTNSPSNVQDWRNILPSATCADWAQDLISLQLSRKFDSVSFHLTVLVVVLSKNKVGTVKDFILMSSVALRSPELVEHLKTLFKEIASLANNHDQVQQEVLETLLNKTVKCLLVLLPETGTKRLNQLSNLVQVLHSTERETGIQLITTVLELANSSRRAAIATGFAVLEYLEAQPNSSVFIKTLMKQLELNASESDSEATTQLLKALMSTQSRIVENYFPILIVKGLSFHQTCILSAVAVAQAEELDPLFQVVSSILDQVRQSPEERELFSLLNALIQRDQELSKLGFQTLRLYNLLTQNGVSYAEAVKFTRTYLNQLNTATEKVRQLLPLLMSHTDQKVVIELVIIYLTIWEKGIDDNRMHDISIRFLGQKSTEETHAFLQTWVKFIQEDAAPYQLAFKVAEVYLVLNQSAKLTPLLEILSNFPPQTVTAVEQFLVLLEQEDRSTVLSTLVSVLPLLQAQGNKLKLSSSGEHAPALITILSLISEPAIYTLLSKSEAAELWKPLSTLDSSQVISLLHLLKENQTEDHIRTAVMLIQLVPEVRGDLIGYLREDFSNPQRFKNLLTELKPLIMTQETRHLVSLIVQEDTNKALKSLIGNLQLIASAQEHLADQLSLLATHGKSKAAFQVLRLFITLVVRDAGLAVDLTKTLLVDLEAGNCELERFIEELAGKETIPASSASVLYMRLTQERKMSANQILPRITALQTTETSFYEHVLGFFQRRSGAFSVAFKLAEGYVAHAVVDKYPRVLGIISDFQPQETQHIEELLQVINTEQFSAPVFVFAQETAFTMLTQLPDASEFAQSLTQVFTIPESVSLMEKLSQMDNPQEVQNVIQVVRVQPSYEKLACASSLTDLYRVLPPDQRVSITLLRPTLETHPTNLKLLADRLTPVSTTGGELVTKLTSEVLRKTTPEQVRGLCELPRLFSKLQTSVEIPLLVDFCKNVVLEGVRQGSRVLADITSGLNNGKLQPIADLIKEGSTLEVTQSTLSTTDVFKGIPTISSEGLARIEEGSDRPCLYHGKDYQSLTPGVSFCSKCLNPMCSAFEQVILVPMGYGKFTLPEIIQSLQCPTCHNLSGEATNVVFYLVKWQYTSMTESGEQISSWHFSNTSNYKTIDKQSLSDWKTVTITSFFLSDSEYDLDINIKPIRSTVSSTQVSDLLCNLTFTSPSPPDKAKSTRVPVDLICIIDESGSMYGDKIEKVRDSLRILVAELTPEDRLSIVCFEDTATIRCELIEDKTKLMGYVNNLSAKGGTNIAAGVEKAIEVIQTSQNSGRFVSLILLSDGEDSAAEAKCESLIQKQRLLSQFTLHTIGYGDAHQVDLMKSIAKMGNGTYSSVRFPEDMKAAITLFLGEALSKFAHSIHVKLELNENPCAVQLLKMYGQPAAHKFGIADLSYGCRRDLVFSLRFSPQAAIPLIEAVPLTVLINYTLTNGQQSTRKVILPLKFTDTVSQYEDYEVVEQFDRAECSEAVGRARKFAIDGHFNEAGEEITAQMERLRARTQTPQRIGLMEPLEKAKLKVQDTYCWNQGGLSILEDIEKNLMEQTASINVRLFINKMQAEMIEKAAH